MAISRTQMQKQTQSSPSKLSQERKKAAAKKRKKELNALPNK
jgi:hypothetical protein